MSTTRMFTSPLFLGFDHLEQMIERASKTASDGYPPYNIEQVSHTGMRISLPFIPASMLLPVFPHLRTGPRLNLSILSFRGVIPH